MKTRIRLRSNAKWLCLGTAAALSLAYYGAGSTAEEAPAPILSGKLFTNEQGELSPALRSLVKRGPDYQPIGQDPKKLFDALEASMADRRKVAWQVVEQMLSPQSFEIEGKTFQIPLWHTWYEGSAAPPNQEFYGKIDLFFAKMKACKQASPNGQCSESYEQLADETMNDFDGKADPKNIANSLTDENMQQILAQLEGEKGSVEHLGTGFTLFSPSFVRHVLIESKGLMNCEADHAKDFEASTPPPSDDQFSPCIKEFPTSAVMVKTSWTRGTKPNVVHDTSESAMKTLFGLPRWPQGTEVPFDSKKMYTIETKEGTQFGLRSIHFSTKDTREWLWVTLWWDPQPNADFGQDRPDSIKGVWANYKMCVTSSFNEHDPTPWKSFETSAPELAKSLKANFEQLTADNAAVGGDPAHLTTWCSNPNVETHAQNQKTNCIGCHQYAGSWNKDSGALTDFFDTLQVDPNFPQLGRDRHRLTFLSDFSWGLAKEEDIPNKIREARLRYGITSQE
jgi:hypothetical protein